jgi:hypothetical protein
MSTFSSTGQNRRPSRLVEILRSYSSSHGGPGFGFKQSVDKPRRVAALVASFQEIDLDAIAAAAVAGVDAVEIRYSGRDDVQHLRQMADRLAVPFGMTLPPDADASTAASAVEARADWVRLPLAGHISTMEWEKPARVLTVPFELELDLAQGLNGLAVDAVLIDQAGGAPSEFTYADALRLRALSELMKKPLLLHAGRGLPPGAAAACEHLGADALLVDVEGLRSIATLSEYLAALQTRAERP